MSDIGNHYPVRPYRREPRTRWCVVAALLAVSVVAVVYLFTR